MPKCKNCNSHISEDFRRVFSNRSGKVHACPNCSPQAGISEASQSRQ